jgi:light-regulated signal transduction histidine kinase (bacteriophytochrome)
VVQHLAKVDHLRQEACISLKDIGVGMDKEQLEAQLGHPLASTPGTSDVKGTGMSIKIRQQLRPQNQFGLQVISEKDVGS